jgi:hypothetical protein
MDKNEMTLTDLALDWDDAFGTQQIPEDAGIVSIPDALILSLSNLGRVDIDYIIDQTGESYSSVVDALKGSIYQNPERWETVFDITTPSGTVFHRLSIPAIGTHMVYDAAYAVTIGLELGMSESEIRTGLMNYQNEKLRQTLVPVGDVTVLADCYNAAPESMCEAIHVLVSYAKARGGRAVAVLGDMRELGEATRRMHETVGEEAATLGVACLMTLGDLGISIAEGAMGAGMADDSICMVRELDDLTPAAEQLWDILQPGDVVFFQNTYKAGLSHVGIYVGNGQFIHAPSSGKVVSYSNLYTNYYIEHYYGAVRFTK